MKKNYYVENFVSGATQVRLEEKYGACTDAQLVNAARGGDSSAADYLFFVRCGEMIADAACRSFRRKGSERKVLAEMGALYMDCVNCGWKNMVRRNECAGLFLARLMEEKIRSGYNSR